MSGTRDLANFVEDLADFIEVERYEFNEGPAYHFAFDRREFMKVFGGGIALIIPLSNVLAHEGQRQGGESGREAANQRVPSEIGAWIHIDEDGWLRDFLGMAIRESTAEQLGKDRALWRLQQKLETVLLF